MEERLEYRRQREIIQLLLDRAVISQEQLDAAKEESNRTGLTVLVSLEKLGVIAYEDISKVRAQAMEVAYMDLADYTIDKGLAELIPEAVAKKYNVVPLFLIQEELTVGMIDPKDVIALDQVRRVSKIDNVDAVLVSSRSLRKVLDEFYKPVGSIDEIVKTIDQRKIADVQEEESLIKMSEEAPIVKLVNHIVSQAIREKASDIHIEPDEQYLRVRYRIDGVLSEACQVPVKIQSAIASRIKILSAMDISEMRRPQDGRFKYLLEGKEIDLRVSSFPTVCGENIVIRLLDKSSLLLSLVDIGFFDDDLKTFENMIRAPNGILLVTGPTGSGKTTTLYSALSTINSVKKNIITIEDPVEYRLPLIRQTQINPKAGINFATGLRNILRQDPDVIMVGEIRDKETVDVAIQAALTGHFVLSTLHTNDAATAITRLNDMGVEPYLISSSIIGVIAQRLVRVNCEYCKERYHPTTEILKKYGISPDVPLYRGAGCLKCKKTGFAGRIAVFEMLVVSEEIKRLIDLKVSAYEIYNKAKQMGMKSLQENGILQVLKGKTTLEEVLRVTVIT